MTLGYIPTVPRGNPTRAMLLSEQMHLAARQCDWRRVGAASPSRTSQSVRLFQLVTESAPSCGDAGNLFAVVAAECPRSAVRTWATSATWPRDSGGTGAV